MLDSLDRVRRALLVSCCGFGVVVGSTISTLSADPDKGKALAERWCASCHLVDRDQIRATDQAPPFTSIARMPDFDVNKLAFLLKPHPNMPMLSLDRTEIADIAATSRRSNRRQRRAEAGTRELSDHSCLSWLARDMCRRFRIEEASHQR
jgi:mono/diheme cytochrome c family protein